MYFKFAILFSVCVLLAGIIMLWPNTKALKLDTPPQRLSQVVIPFPAANPMRRYAAQPMNPGFTKNELLAQRKKQRALTDTITDGNLKPKLDSIRKLMEDDLSPELYQLVRIQYIETVLQLSGDEPAAYIRSLAEDNMDNCVVINELVWEFVTRSENGETLRPKIVTALVESINLALEADPNSTNALDTKAHLFELAGDLDSAIKTAEKAVELSQKFSPDSLPKPDYVQYLIKLRNSNSTD